MAALLASGCESAAVGQSEPQELMGIHRSVINADFVVQVWTGAATAQPDISDRIAPSHKLSGNNRIARKMPVAGGNSVAVVKRDSPPISTHKIGESHHAIGWSDDRLPVGSRDVDSTMERALAVERIGSLSERSRHRTFYRPKVGS